MAEFRSDMPEPQIRYDKDVKIRIRKCGICGSEVHALHGMHPFRIPPVLSGHEFAGDVVEVGKGVTKFKPGDRVTGEPQYGCGECYYCKHGMYNLCTSKRVLGASYKVPELDNGEWTGSMGEYIVVPEKTVVKLADNVSYEEGALIEPVANGIYAPCAVQTSRRRAPWRSSAAADRPGRPYRRSALRPEAHRSGGCVRDKPQNGPRVRLQKCC